VSGAEVLLGAELIGGGSANTAITNGSNGTFYTRNITPAGYLHTTTDANGATTNDGPSRSIGREQHRVFSVQVLLPES
jgi:hypothetical protein